MRDRAWRRSQMRIHKQRMVRRFKQWHWGDQLDSRQIGRFATTPHPCSCWMCGHQREIWGPTINELRHEPLDMDEELDYIEEDTA